MSETSNRRILIVDDNASIHGDYKKILGGSSAGTLALADAKAAFFGPSASAAPAADAEGAYEFDSAFQGQEALEKVRQSLVDKRPFALAFVDVRMPPGWDGVETVARLWEADAQLQVVICTAFADYSWEDMTSKLGKSDRLLILKKPFDPIEVVQLATALVEKWNSARRERERLEQVRSAELEARSYAASLTTINRALENAKASAEAASTNKSEFLERLAGVLQHSGDSILAALDLACEPGLDAGRRAASLDSVHEQCLALRNAARNLNVHAELELEKLEPVLADFSPGDFLDSVAARWRTRADSAGLRLASECLGPVPEHIRGDAQLVAGVLDALVDNAIRFTQRGGVKLQARMLDKGEDEDTVLEVRVNDTGVGIAQDVQARVFEPLDAGDSEPARGAHFSLCVARRMARFLGGELRLESTPGEGSTFSLQLPTGDLTGVALVEHPRRPLPAIERSEAPQTERSDISKDARA